MMLPYTLIVGSSLFWYSKTFNSMITTCSHYYHDNRTAGQKYEISASSLKLIGDCPSESYPLQKKRHSQGNEELWKELSLKFIPIYKIMN